jgi:hypothetical protein
MPRKLIAEKGLRFVQLALPNGRTLARWTEAKRKDQNTLYIRSMNKRNQDGAQTKEGRREPRLATRRWQRIEARFERDPKGDLESRA